MEAAAAGHSRIFDGLNDSERQAWIAGATACALRRGATLIRQGEPAERLYVVESGLLKLVQPTDQGRHVIARFVGPSEPVGGVVALEGGAYPVTAIAVAPTRLHVWTRSALVPLLQRFPQVRANITRELASHMTDAMSRVRELTTERVEQRLARAILRLADQCGHPTTEGIRIEHALTRQDLADITGTTLYTVSRTLSQWESEGRVRSAGRRIIVRSPEALRARALDAEES
jgi:CRP-like cAMP-binding protein